MFNVNNAAVTASELEAFVALVTGEIDSQPLDPQPNALVLAVDDHGSVQMFATRDPGHPAATAQIDQLLARRRRVVAVRRIVEDDQWMQAPPDALPWFVLSTAAALRTAIEQGTPRRLKQAHSPELYSRPGELPDPPVDDRGQL